MTKDFIEETIREFDEQFDVETSGRDGNDYFSGCHACEMSPNEIKKFLHSVLLSQRASILAEVEGVIGNEEKTCDCQDNVDSCVDCVYKGIRNSLRQQQRIALKEALSTLK